MWHVDNPQVNFVEQSVHLHSHDPAMTSLVETAAELRKFRPTNVSLMQITDSHFPAKNKKSLNLKGRLRKKERFKMIASPNLNRWCKPKCNIT